MATFERTDPDGDIAAALAGIRTRLDILVPSGSQERYHQLVEGLKGRGLRQT